MGTQPEAIDTGASVPQPGRFAASPWRRRARLEALPVAVAGALVAYLALVPLGYLLWKTFAGPGGLTLEHLRDAYGEAGLGSTVRNSLWFAAGSSVIAVTSGAGLAFVLVRTDLRFKRLFFAGSLVPLILPGILYTIAWILLASGRIGALRDLLPTGLDVFSMGGMMLVEGLHLSPLVFLLMAAAFSSADPALEEAALMSGARLRTVLRRITLPLVRPALYAALLVMVVRALESFEVPVLLGIPEGIWVFTSRIWRSLDTFPAQLDRAGAYSVSLLVITGLGVLLYSRVVSAGARHQTITGRGRQPRQIVLGRWRPPVLGLTAAYLLIASGLPLLMLVYASTQRFYSAPSLTGLTGATLENFGSLLGHEATVRSFGNSLLLATGTATVVMVAMSVAAWMVVRGRLPGRGIVDGLASLPLVIPGLVLGVALMFVYLRFPLPLYGTLWILFLAYFTRFMPYGMRYAVSAMHQIGLEQEEAARMSGASWSQAFRRVTLPLLLPGLLAGWLYVVIVAMRELASSIVLYSPGSEVLAVRIFVLYEGGQLPELAALGVVMVVVLACLAALAQRLGARAGVWTE